MYIKKMKKSTTLIILMILMINFIKPLSALAATGAEYGVKVLYPENHLKETGDSGYFDLIVEPGETYDLEVEIQNFSKNKITVIGEVSRAGTTSTGLLNYHVNQEESEKIAERTKLDKNLDFYNMIETKKEKLQIEPESTKKFKIQLKIPEISFDGEILGGLYFRQEKEELKKEEKEQMIINAFSYSIPVILQMKQNRVENELSLGEVGPELRDSHPFISAEILNSRPSIIRNLKVDGKINDKTSGTTVYVRKEDRYQMAPHSILNYGFDLQDTPIKPGSYETILKIEADGKNYELKKDFVIEKKESEEFNESSVFLMEEENNTYLYIIVAIVTIVVLLTVVFVILKINKSKRGK